MTQVKTAPHPVEPPRLIDLRIDWLAQYAPETNLFGPETYARGSKDLSRIDGYLGTTSAAFLMLGRDPADWARRADPWLALDELIARCEAEFAGRLLIGPDDFTRWRDDPHGMTWGVLGIGGLDSLVRTEADLSCLPALFERGVRSFQATSTALNALPDLGLAFLEALDGLNRANCGPRPILDMAGMSARSRNEMFAWFETDPSRSNRIQLMQSHGPIVVEDIVRLRAVGGFVGLGASSRSFDNLDELRFAISTVASIPLSGKSGYAGIGLATDSFGGGDAFDRAKTASDLIAWAIQIFGSAVANALIYENASQLIEQCVAR